MKRKGDVTAPQAGIVMSVNKEAYRVKVLLPLLDYETDWIRVSSKYVGAGWGLVVLPTPGTEVAVQFLDGDINQGYVSDCFYSDEVDRPPVEAAAPALIHASGTVLRFCANGDVELQPKGNLLLAGGGPAVARVGDSVACPCGTGTISAGSGKVFCGG